MRRQYAPMLLAVVLCACGVAEPTPESSTTSAPTSSPTAQATDEAEPSEAAHPPIVPTPAGVLPPASVAQVTADGLRVRAGPPHWGMPSHAEVIYSLSAGDIVLIGSSPLSYVPPESSPDGHGWYEVHVGGPSATSYIDGGINGWVAEGEHGLEYLKAEPVVCPDQASLETLLHPPGQGVDPEVMTTGWDRLACLGGERLELEGVFEYLCNEVGIYPYEFSPAFIAWPQTCSGMIRDDIDPDGYGRAGALPLRFPAAFGDYPQRGDVVRVVGHFDDPVSSTCSAEPPPGFDGVAIDLEFLVLFCREQFVVDEVTIIGHRDLAPLPWEP